MQAADNLLLKIDETIQEISRTPGMGGRHENYGAGIRAFPVGKYIIFYQKIDEGIEVIRVLHRARNLDDLL